MPGYRRWRVGGGVYFFTLVTHQRMPILTRPDSRGALRSAIQETCARLPFQIDAVVLLPDHLHMLLRLPPGDDDFPSRLAKLKRNFTQAYLAGGGQEGAATRSRRRQRYRGVWQKRYYEHCIRDWRDFKLHLDYVHVNPVKHGLVALPVDWPWSTFKRWADQGEYDEGWCGHVRPCAGKPFG